VILIDYRQGSADLARAWKEARIAEAPGLVFADVAFLGKGPDDRPLTIGIELKGLAELLGDLTSKRFLGRQAPGMRRTYDVCWLVVEGKHKQGRGGTLEVPRTLGWQHLTIGQRAFSWETLQALLMTITQKAGIHVKCTDTRGQTLDFCKRLASWWAVGWDRHHAMDAFYQPPTGELVPRDHTLLRRVLKELPGVGWKRSGEAEAYFASVRDMANADPDRFRAIDGISEKRAVDIVEALTEEEVF